MAEYTYFDAFSVRITDLGNGVTEVLIEAEAPSVAGEVSLDCGHGVTVRADFAEPQKLLGIDIEFSRSDVLSGERLPFEVVRLLESLVGSQSASEVEAVAGSFSETTIAIRGNGGPVPIDHDGLKKNLRSLALGNAMHLLEIANDPEELLGVRVIAAFEAMSERHRTGYRVEDEIVARRAVTALDRIRMADAQGPSDYEDLAGDLEALPSIDVKISHMTLDLLRENKVGLPPSLQIFKERVQALLQERLSNLFRERSDSAEHVEGEKQKTATVVNEGLEEVSPGRLRAGWKKKPEGSHLRVLDRGDGSILAVAPIRQTDSGWVAEALFPLDLTLDRLEVHPTDNPFPVGEISQIDKILGAIELGRLAMSQMIGRDSISGSHRETWAACATAWESLGDLERAEQAGEYARGMNTNRAVFHTDWVRRRLTTGGQKH